MRWGASAPCLTFQRCPMAYATPTVVLTGNTATAAVPTTLTATITSSGTVGIKVRRIEFQAAGGSVTFGKDDFRHQIGQDCEFGAGSLATDTDAMTTEYLTNAGGGATTIIKVPVVYNSIGSASMICRVYLTRDDSGAAVVVVPSALAVTVS